MEFVRQNLAKHFIDGNKGLISSFFRAYKMDNFWSISGSILVSAIDFCVVVVTKRLLEIVSEDLSTQEQGKGKITKKEEVLYLSLIVVFGGTLYSLIES